MHVLACARACLCTCLLVHEHVLAYVSCANVCTVCRCVTFRFMSYSAEADAHGCRGEVGHIVVVI